MTIDDILKLTTAGFTAEQVTAMLPLIDPNTTATPIAHSATHAHAQPANPAPKEAGGQMPISAPAPAPLPNTENGSQPSPAPAPNPQPAPAPATDPIMEKLNQMQQQMFGQNIINSSNPMPVADSAESILASIINPPVKPT